MGKQDHPPQSWEHAWRAAERYRGFLRTLASRYRGLLLADGTEDAEDVLQTFVIDKLPWIVERLDALPDEQERERYLVVAFKNFVLSHRRAAQRYRRAIDAFAEEPPAFPAGAVSPRPVPPVDPTELAPALQVYLALRGDIRHVAQTLDISRYAARKAVVDGALLLAIRLGQQGALDPRELAVCKQVLLHGLSVENTASVLGLTETQVKHALASARDVMGRSLTG